MAVWWATEIECIVFDREAGAAPPPLIGRRTGCPRAPAPRSAKGGSRSIPSSRCAGRPDACSASTSQGRGRAAGGGRDRSRQGHAGRIVLRDPRLPPRADAARREGFSVLVPAGPRRSGRPSSGAGEPGRPCTAPGPCRAGSGGSGSCGGSAPSATCRSGPRRRARAGPGSTPGRPSASSGSELRAASALDCGPRSGSTRSRISARFFPVAGAEPTGAARPRRRGRA